MARKRRRCCSSFDHGRVLFDAIRTPLLDFVKDGADRSHLVPFTVGTGEAAVDALPRLFDSETTMDWRVRRPSVAAPGNKASFDLVSVLPCRHRVAVNIHFTGDGMARLHQREAGMSVYRCHGAVPPPTVEEMAEATSSRDARQ